MPREASSTATAAATVVFPTPPLPITMTSPWSKACQLVDEARSAGSSGVGATRRDAP